MSLAEFDIVSNHSTLGFVFVQFSTIQIACSIISGKVDVFEFRVFYKVIEK